MKKATLTLTAAIAMLMMLFPLTSTAQEQAEERKLEDSPNIIWNKS